jgi:hypothetical protein
MEVLGIGRSFKPVRASPGPHGRVSGDPAGICEAARPRLWPGLVQTNQGAARDHEVMVIGALGIGLPRSGSWGADRASAFDPKL